MDFSIIVPTCNRPARLNDCLAALALLDYPRDRFEVVVVDDGGRAPLQKVIEPFERRLSVRLLVTPHGGPAAARNRGGEAARGPMLAFTDDDCAPAADWLAQLHRACERHSGFLLGGHTVNAIAYQLAPAASQLLVDYLYQHFNPDPEDARFIVSCNLAVPADAFRELGGFDTSFPNAAAEDRDLCDRWRDRGWRMAYLPEARVYHRHALSLASFWRQHLVYGRGAYRLQQVRLARRHDRLRVERLGFYARMLAYPFTRRAPQPARLSALLALSQTANAAGFFGEALRARLRQPGKGR